MADGDRLAGETPASSVTLDSFIEALSTTPRPEGGWVVLKGEIVDGGEGFCCPWLWMRTHGVKYEPRVDVFNAADGRDGHDKALRARLLAACGLASVSEPEPSSATQEKTPEVPPEVRHG